MKYTRHPDETTFSGRYYPIILSLLSNDAGIIRLNYKANIRQDYYSPSAEEPHHGDGGVVGQREPVGGERGGGRGRSTNHGLHTDQTGGGHRLPGRRQSPQQIWMVGRVGALPLLHQERYLNAAQNTFLPVPCIKFMCKEETRDVELIK